AVRFRGARRKAAGGSAFTKKFRPSLPEILAICPSAAAAEKAKTRMPNQTGLELRVPITFGEGALVQPTDTTSCKRPASARRSSVAARSRPSGRKMPGQAPAAGRLASGAAVPWGRIRRGPREAARTWIIATARAGRALPLRYYLARLCPFRQPRPDRAFRRRFLPLAGPAPVSPCRHGP